MTDDQSASARSTGHVNHINPKDLEKRAHEKADPTQAKIEELAALTLLDYDRVRNGAAEELGCRKETLDTLVKEARTRQTSPEDECGQELEHGVEAWPDHVDGLELFQEIQKTLGRYVVLKDEAITAITLWVMVSYCVQYLSICPKLLLSSPEKRCGKTTTLELLAALVRKSILAANVSLSALFRIVEEWHPTLLIDELDALMKNNQNDDLRGLINAGHSRTGTVLRVEEIAGKHQVKKFSAYGAMVLAGIGRPHETIVDRSIVIVHRRKLSTEVRERLAFGIDDQLQPTRRRLQRWADDYGIKLIDADPEIPIVPNDRAMDNWRPMISIADLLGGEIPAQARSAMMVLESLPADDRDGIGPKLLSDIRKVFEEDNLDRIHSADLASALVKFEGSPWSDWRNGKPMTAAALSRQLRKYDIHVSQTKVGTVNKQGFLKSDFEDAWARYTSPPLAPPEHNPTTLQPSSGVAYSPFKNPTENHEVGFKKVLQPSKDEACRVVGFSEPDIEVGGRKKGTEKKKR